MKFFTRFLLVLFIFPVISFTAIAQEEPEVSGVWGWATEDSISVQYKAVDIASNGDIFWTFYSTSETGNTYWDVHRAHVSNHTYHILHRVPFENPGSTWGLAVNELVNSIYVMRSQGDLVELVYFTEDGDSLWTVNLDDLPMSHDIVDIFKLDTDVYGNAVLTGMGEAYGNAQNTGALVLKIDPNGSLIMNNVFSLGSGNLFSWGDTQVKPNGDVQVTGRNMVVGEGFYIINSTFVHEENGGFANTQMTDIADGLGVIPQILRLDHHGNSYVVSAAPEAGAFVDFHVTAFDAANQRIWDSELPGHTGQTNERMWMDDMVADGASVWVSGHHSRTLVDTTFSGINFAKFDMTGEIVHHVYTIDRDSLYTDTDLEYAGEGGVMLMTHIERAPLGTELNSSLNVINYLDPDNNNIWRYVRGIWSETQRIFPIDSYMLGNRFYNLYSTNGALRNMCWSFMLDYTVGVKEDVEIIPAEFELTGIYPNPFNASTSIEMKIKQAGEVNINVYNLLGQEVASIWNGNLMAGQHRLNFNGKDLASGTYLLNVSTPEGISESRKIVLLK